MNEKLDIVWHKGCVSEMMRAEIMQQNPFVIWFTGLSGSGKSTVSSAVEMKLFEMGKYTFLLDGDNIRHGLCSDLDFSERDRKENLRRIGELAKLFTEGGLITLTAFISPFIEDRQKIRDLFPCGNFVEVFVDCPIEVCEERDVKGLYNKARQGVIKNFTGINSPYEPPAKPELTINTSSQTLEESVESVLSFLSSRGLIRDRY